MKEKGLLYVEQPNDIWREIPLGSGKRKFIEYLTDLLELIERVKNSYDELICGGKIKD